MVTKIDGNHVKKTFLEDIQKEILSLKTSLKKVPGLAVILVGDDPASRVYVSSKKRTCENLGMNSFEYLFSNDVSENELVDCIHELNQNSDVHGILLQMPLPKHLNADQLLHLISPDKDVDGFHPLNVGKLLIGLPTFKSCTPYGVCQLLDFYNISTEGKHVVVIGRSNIVGKPIAAMLMQKSSPGNSTVTVCHSRTQNMTDIVSSADIVIAAIGKAHFVTADMIKPGAVVIDVGINRVDDPSSKKGYKLVGDVDYDDVLSKVSAITPVPGGVGRLRCQ